MNLEESQDADPIEDAKAFIEEIRRDRGLDQNQVFAKRNINALDLEGLLDLVAKELYSQTTHFLLEFIQNADDSNYADGVKPSITFKSFKSSDSFYFRMDSNETGFTNENVMAICRCRASTKKDRTKGYIGEKGIGFKSCFKIADIVHISSNAFSFKFDAKAYLGMATPQWAEFPPKEKLHDMTQFLLELRSKDDQEGLAKQLERLDASLLLFLRRLREIRVFVAHENRKPREYVLTREDYQGPLGSTTTLLDSLLGTTQRYVVSRHKLEGLPRNEEKRAGITASEITLAFPVDEKNQPSADTQMFLIEADFLLITNHEDIDNSPAWNITLHEGISDAFANAIQHEFNSTLLKYIWPSYLVDENSVLRENFFSSLTENIIEKLQTRQILESEDGVLRSPSHLLIIPAEYRDEYGNSLLSSKYCSLAYLNRKYLSSVHEILMRLGTELMEFERFFEMFQDYLSHRAGRPFRAETHDWHGRVSRLPLQHPSMYSVFRQLQLIPLRCGYWTSVQSNSRVYFDTVSSVRIPEGLEQLDIVDPLATENQDRKALFSALGVVDCTDAEICERIIATHKTAAPGWLYGVPEGVLISHLLRIYRANLTLRSMDLKMLERDKSRLLHPNFVNAITGKNQSKGVNFLIRDLGVWNIPKLVEDGKLSQDFQSIIDKLQPRNKFLEVLRNNWARYEKDITTNDKLRETLRKTLVLCEDNKERQLEKTFLPLPAPKVQLGLPFVKIADISDSRWLKLAELGVTIKAGLEFYLGCLESMQNTPVTKQKAHDLYMQIHSRLIEGTREVVRKAFAKGKPVLIPDKNGNRWVSLRDCVWEAPPCLHSSTALAIHYRDLHTLFCSVLGVQDATIDQVVERLKTIKPEEDDEDDLQIVKGLDFALNSFLEQKQDCRELRSLKTVDILPVSAFSNGHKKIKYISMGKSGWYFLDRKWLFECCKERTYLADFTIDEVRQLSPLIAKLSLKHLMLSEAVTEENTISDERVPNAEWTAILNEKCSYLKRIIAVSDPITSPNLTCKLAKLDRLEVIGVAEVRLRTVIHTTGARIEGSDVAGRLVLHDEIHEQKRLQLFVPMEDLQRGTLSRTPLSEEFIKYLEVRQDKFKILIKDVIIEDHPASIEEILEVHGIGNGHARTITPKDVPPRRMPKPTNVPAVQEPVETKPSLSQHGEDPRPISAAENILPPSSRGIIAAPKPDVKAPEGPRLDRSRSYAPARRSSSSEKAEILYQGPSMSWRTWGIDDEIEASQIGGLRERAGHPKFLGNEERHADFTFRDVKGKVTDWLVRKGRKEAKEWLPASPRYHFEVKATTRGVGEVMHWSESQAQLAREYKIPKSGIPTDVYVLLRVYNLRSTTPMMYPFVDPTSLKQAGELVFRATGWEVWPGKASH